LEEAFIVAPEYNGSRGYKIDELDRQVDAEIVGRNKNDFQKNR